MSLVYIWPKFFSVDLICLQTGYNVASLAEPPTNWVVYYVWRWIDLLLSSNKSRQTQPTISTIKSPILEFGHHMKLNNHIGQRPCQCLDCWVYEKLVYICHTVWKNLNKQMSYTYCCIFTFLSLNLSLYLAKKTN